MRYDSRAAQHVAYVLLVSAVQFEYKKQQTEVDSPEHVTPHFSHIKSDIIIIYTVEHASRLHARADCSVQALYE